MCSCFYIHVLETLSSAAQTHQHSHAHILLVVVLLNFIQLSSAPIHADYAQPGLYRNTQTRTCAPTHAHTRTHRHTPPDCLAYSRHSLIVLRESQGQQVPSLIDSTWRGWQMNKARNAYTHITLRSM